jgi:hypothetical protein
MASPVLERDLQEMDELEGAALRGDEVAKQTLFFRLSDLAKDLTKWQWVIHGDSVVYRQRCVRWLVRQGRLRQARRFALCGRGDVGMVGQTEGSVRIKPMGCGARFCPRCSRRYGRRFLSRVVGHLSSEPHGQIWHMVLTQRVIPEESLAKARKRFGSSWKAFYVILRKLGMQSALATYHVMPSSVKGWHFHCHVLIEFADGVDGAKVEGLLDGAWFKALGDGETQRKPLFMRKVSDPGPAFDGLTGDVQMEFWAESRNPVEVVLQYVLRDVLQGVEGWISRISTDVGCEEFAEALSHAKLHRLYGVWRKKLVEEAKDEAGSSEGSTTVGSSAVRKCKDTEIWSSVGTMDEVLHWAKNGMGVGLDVVRRLLGRSANRGSVALRLSRLVAGLAG